MSIDTSKIIHGVVGGGRYTVTSPIVKEDYGLYLLIEGLELPSTYEVDFSNSEHNGTSVTMIGNADGVLIPRQFITTGKDVFAFLYHVGADYGRTVYKFRIPNKLRPDRTDEQPTPEEQSTIDQAISALNDAVAQTAQDVIDADASAQSASESAEQAETARDTAQTYANNAQTSANNASASASQASASATASAQSASQAEQIKTDVQGMVSDAQGYASASAQSATASANSASQASASATSASQSATSAQGYASQAQTSAQTATAKASEASTSASMASTKASESAQSATNAQGYANTAESAKTASQTAQGLAESARDTAVSAKADAESARDDAETARDEAQQAVASISGALADKAPVITDTASGSIASFSDGADNLPLKSLIVDINPIQDLSHGDPSPENICPISGWTGCNVNATGHNIWDEQWEKGGLNSYGEETSQSDRIRSKNYIHCKPNTTYYFKNSGTENTYSLRCYKLDKGFISSTSAKTASATFTTPNDCFFIRFINIKTTYDNDISINYPSTDHDYHPYTGRSIPISWQTEAGTVYGGKLDVLSGVMRVEKAQIDLATLTEWASNMSGTNAIEIRCTLNGKKEGRTNLISNMLKTGTETSATDVAAYSVRGFPTSASIAVKAPKAVVTDSNGLLAWIGENHPMVCYELATPIEIQLDAHTVNSLYGQNNIFADTGDCSVEYRADTTLYISRLTEPDADMIADSNIVSGQYFMVGNSLYKATANIANGSAIIVGTNCIRKSLSEALNEINA